MDNPRIEYYWRKYKHRIGAYAFGILKKPETKIVWGQWEDVVQDAFIYLREIEDLSPSLVLRYLFTKVRNDCSNILRRHKMKEGHHEQIYYLADEDYWDSRIIKSGVHSELVKQIESIIDNLPVGQRLIFRMRYFEDAKQREIAKLLNISVNTVNQQIHRAKTRIREALGELKIDIY